jgi:hypothetical protein
VEVSSHEATLSVAITYVVRRTQLRQIAHFTHGGAP